MDNFNIMFRIFFSILIFFCFSILATTHFSCNDDELAEEFLKCDEFDFILEQDLAGRIGDNTEWKLVTGVVRDDSDSVAIGDDVLLEFFEEEINPACGSFGYDSDYITIMVPLEIGIYDLSPHLVKIGRCIYRDSRT